MHLPGKKNTQPEVSEPQDLRKIDDQPHPQMIYNSEGITLPADATNASNNPRLGATAEAGHAEISPRENAPLGMSNPAGDPEIIVVEKKLPFKEQVRAYHKIQHGTLVGDKEQKELGKAILHGDVPPQ